MLDDANFLAQLEANPTDDAARLVYADWLEEQGDASSAVRAEFLRLTARLATAKTVKSKTLRKRLQELAAGLDTDWLGVVSRLPIENCQGKREKSGGGSFRIAGVSFEYLCDRRWEDLAPTDDQAVRFCDACQHSVHYCATITEAREHAWERHCIAVDLGVIRRENDLALPMSWVGRPSPEMVRRQNELNGPDPVSAERERRKREKGAGMDG
jgi:uncharacterized protein (TIGR02996 family)